MLSRENSWPNKGAAANPAIALRLQSMRPAGLVAELGLGTPVDRFVYVAWFRNDLLPPDDQDHEWVACFLVEAETATDAQAWGDHLARRRSARYPDEPFLWSEVRLPDDPMFAGCSLDLPCVACGVDATDDVIGW